MSKKTRFSHQFSYQPFRKIFILLILVALMMYLVLPSSSNQTKQENRKRLNIAILIKCSEWDGTEKSHVARLNAIMETWGKDLNLTVIEPYGTEISKFKQFFPQHSINFITPDHSKTNFVLWGIEEMFQIYPDLDWVVKIDDVSFLFLENLHSLLSLFNSSKPYFLGHRLKLPGGLIFNSAACYVLSRGAVEQLQTNYLSDCATRHGQGEDLAIAECLLRLRIEPFDTRDAETRELFHVFQPSALVGDETDTYNMDIDWYKSYRWYGYHKGVVCCSPFTVVFHYLSTNEIYALGKIFYEQRERFLKLLEIEPPQDSNWDANWPQPFKLYQKAGQVKTRKLLKLVLSQVALQETKRLRLYNETF